jgi:hypothetical protein
MCPSYEHGNRIICNSYHKDYLSVAMIKETVEM